GTNFRISTPNAIRRRSMTSSVDTSAWSAIAFSSSGRYSGFCTALRISDGFVVASCGVYALIDWKSPVSATTVVNCLSCSSWFMGGLVVGLVAVGGVQKRGNHRFQAGLVFLCETFERRAVDIEDADQLAVLDQRNHDLGIRRRIA